MLLAKNPAVQKTDLGRYLVELIQAGDLQQAKNALRESAWRWNEWNVQQVFAYIKSKVPVFVIPAAPYKHGKRLESAFKENEIVTQADLDVVLDWLAEWKAQPFDVGTFTWKLGDWRSKALLWLARTSTPGISGQEIGGIEL